MASPQTIPDICAALNQQGYPVLSLRIAYLASNEDLENEESPMTLESALGFWEFFQAIESEGKVDLACSPEGCVSAVWRFPCDKRRACLWFLDSQRVRFIATDSDGNFIRIAGNGNENCPEAVMETLVCANVFARK